MAIKKRILLKFGGEVVEDPKSMENLFSSLKEIHEQGKYNVVMVHGGGPYATALANRLNVKTEKVAGRRITNDEMLEVMKMSLPGVIQSNILAKAKEFGLPVVPVSGVNIVQCHKRPPKIIPTHSETEKVDFGHVGDVEGVDESYVNFLIEGGYIPIISPLSCDASGNLLNINADTIACQVAKKASISDMFLVTAVGGVFKDIEDPTSRIQTMTTDEAKELISSGVIQGGMIPKVEEGINVLGDELHYFHIVGLNSPTTLFNELQEPGSEGSVVKR